MSENSQRLLGDYHGDYHQEYLREISWNLREVFRNLEICGNGRDTLKVSFEVYKPSVESCHG